MMRSQIVRTGRALDLGAYMLLVGTGWGLLPLALLPWWHPSAVQRARYRRLREIFIRNARDKIKDLARQRAHEICLSVGAAEGPRLANEVHQLTEVALDKRMSLMSCGKAESRL